MSDENTTKTIGVVLSGAGYLDGSEVQEAVLCLLALAQSNVTVRVFAPKKDLDVVDHLTGKPTGKRCSLLTEAARIVRGKVAALSTVTGSEVDAWVFPGGFGAAKNLCDFAHKGADATAEKETARVVRSALAAQIPIGACCIAPALLAVITKSSGPRLKLTIGNDADTIAALQNMGVSHEACGVDEICVDDDHKVVSTPAYMYDEAPVDQVFAGIKKMVDQVVEWTAE